MKELEHNLDNAFRQIKPLAMVVEKPLNFFSLQENGLGVDEVKSMLMESSARVGMEKDFSISPAPSKHSTSFEYAMSACLAKSINKNNCSQGFTLSEVVNAVDIQVGQDLKLCGYDSGEDGREAIVIIIPCGMPATIVAPWLIVLKRYFRVLTWESRALFGKCDTFDSIDVDINSQVSDLFKLLDHTGINCAHVVGLCSGATLAILAAVKSSERVLSLSLLHGDYEFREDSLRSPHQKDVLAMLSQVGSSRAIAKAMFSLFSRPSVLKTINGDLAHMMLYPYATPELLFRYGKLNGEIMNTDLRDCLGKVSTPTLVITSKEDMTASPEGSIYASKYIPEAILHISEKGHHASLFEAQNVLMELVISFLKRLEK